MLIGLVGSSSINCSGSFVAVIVPLLPGVELFMPKILPLAEVIFSIGRSFAAKFSTVGRARPLKVKTSSGSGDYFALAPVMASGSHERSSSGSSIVTEAP